MADAAGVEDVENRCVDDARGAVGVVEMDKIEDMNGLRARFVDAGCWIRPFGNIVYLMPAFTIDEEDLTRLTDTVVKVVGGG